MILGMKSDDRELRGVLSQALCRIGKPAVGPLKQRIDDADEILRSCAILTLWKMGEDGVPTIVENVTDDEE